MKANRRISEVSKLLKPQGQSNHIVVTNFRRWTVSSRSHKGNISTTMFHNWKHLNNDVPQLGIPHDLPIKPNGSRTRPMVTNVPTCRSHDTLLRDALPLVAIWVPKRFNRLILLRANLIPRFTTSPRESSETILEFPNSSSCPGGPHGLPDVSVLSGGYEGTEELPFNKTTGRLSSYCLAPFSYFKEDEKIGFPIHNSPIGFLLFSYVNSSSVKS